MTTQIAPPIAGRDRLRKGLMVALGLVLLQAGSALALTVSESQAKKAAIEKPSPVLSPMARQLKISGTVSVEVSIDASGSVRNVKPVTGNPLLIDSVVAAVRRWKFTPFVDDGSVTVTTLTFEFKQ